MHDGNPAGDAVTNHEPDRDADAQPHHGTDREPDSEPDLEPDLEPKYIAKREGCSAAGRRRQLWRI